MYKAPRRLVLPDHAVLPPALLGAVLSKRRHRNVHATAVMLDDEPKPSAESGYVLVERRHPNVRLSLDAGDAGLRGSDRRGDLCLGSSKTLAKLEQRHGGLYVAHCPPI